MSTLKDYFETPKPNHQKKPPLIFMPLWYSEEICYCFPSKKAATLVHKGLPRAKTVINLEINQYLRMKRKGYKRMSQNQPLGSEANGQQSVWTNGRSCYKWIISFWGHSAMARCFPSMCKALASIHNTAKKFCISHVDHVCACVYVCVRERILSAAQERYR